ncbi:hypothetical protein CALVIDRAFT_528690 [Calocera viscosa TUFC12733]|uniref:Uncharacterized protein n=1 Tax=Calocera viscosa (strain TUFC12733) TaxID=1330018 RepID=A0A167KAF2_CALVF|nr:hypothetical protein CALVIDRAFT_528690 [Calocera viscosa TUFC12733]
MPEQHRIIVDYSVQPLDANVEAVVHLMATTKPSPRQVGILIAENLVAGLDEEAEGIVRPKYLCSCCEKPFTVQELNAHACRNLATFLIFYTAEPEAIEPPNFATASQAIEFMWHWERILRRDAGPEHELFIGFVDDIFSWLLSHVEYYARIGQIPYFHYSAIFGECRKTIFGEGSLAVVERGIMVRMRSGLHVAEGHYREELSTKTSERTHVLEQLNSLSASLQIPRRTFRIDISLPLDQLYTELRRWYSYVDTATPGLLDGDDVVTHGTLSCILLDDQIDFPGSTARCMKCLSQQSLAQWWTHPCRPWAAARLYFKKEDAHVDVKEVMALLKKYRYLWPFNVMWGVLSDHVMYAAWGGLVNASKIERMYEEQLIRGDCMDDVHLNQLLGRAQLGL